MTPISARGRKTPQYSLNSASGPGAYDRSVATATPQTGTKTDTRTDTDDPVPWNVVLIDDDEHSYEYVISMMQELFGHSLEKAFKIAQAVDNDGRAVCLTTHKEHAELKLEQIMAYGRDKLMAESKGSMTAIIEPAEFGGDDDEDHGSGDN
jgi:ATP-dependent Clp protease adaptor protein ClpS